MNQASCPHHQVRADLPPLIPRIAALPVDERGYPIPFFVGYLDGKPDFRLADSKKFSNCLRNKLCWVCGQPLGGFKTFVIGPMGCVTRTSPEPPSHLDCAEWSVKGCPFLVKPNMVRRQHEQVKQMSRATPPAGIMSERNPGISAVWTTRSYKTFRAGNRTLFEVGDPVSPVTFWREGRPATRAEINESIETGLPLLQKECQNESDRNALQSQLHWAMRLLPA